MRFERTINLSLPASAASVYPRTIGLPDAEENFWIEGRISYVVHTYPSYYLASPIVVFEGQVDLAEAQDRISQATNFDALLIIPTQGYSGKVRLPSDIRTITLFQTYAISGTQLVQVRVFSD